MTHGSSRLRLVAAELMAPVSQGRAAAKSHTPIHTPIHTPVHTPVHTLFHTLRCGKTGGVRIETPGPYREPEFLPWDGRRVPITFVGGYLGAGKTTAINELLATTDRPIAVVVNDVGSVNIDARLIRRRSADMIELTDGCVCCTSIDGMGAALDSIRARETPPDHVVVELSGVADPYRMVPWGQSAGFRLDGVVIVAAADQLATDSLPQAVRGNIASHIAAADLLVLTKIDLVDDAELIRARHLLETYAPRVPVVESDAGHLRPGALGRFLALGGRRPEGVTSTQSPSMFDLHEVATVPAPGPVSVAELRRYLEECYDASGGRLVRVKAVVDTVDRGLVLVQVVGPRIELDVVPQPELEAATDLVMIRVLAPM